jgi:hypothetical protein
MKLVVHDPASTGPLVDRVGLGRSVVQLVDEPGGDETSPVNSSDLVEFLPPIPTPPESSLLATIFRLDCRQGPVHPCRSEEVEQLDLVTLLLETGEPLNGCPMALECSLIE